LGAQAAAGWMSLGQTEQAAGDRAAALAAFRMADSLSPAEPWPLVEMAAVLRASGAPEAAREALQRALARDPGCIQALEMLGDLSRLEGDIAGARDRYRAALAAQAANPWPWLGLLRCLQEAGEGSQAEALLEEAEAACGTRPELAAARVDLLREQGRLPEALAAARAAAATWPRHPGLWIARFRAERPLAPPAALAACLDAAPAGTLAERARLAQFRGQAAEESWDLAAALARYRDALALQPEDGWTLSDLVRARLLTLDLAGARAALRDLVRRTAAEARLQGRSANPSQTHFGQILDEFALDAPLLAELQALLALAPAARLAPLRALVAAAPDSTVAAIQLLVALRQAGALAVPAAGGPTSGIPPRLAQYWDSGAPPAEIAALMAGWRAAHPGHDATLFDDASARAFLAARCAPAVLAAYARAREPAQKSDLFRLAWLLREGGWYIDADDRCLAPLGSLPAGDAALVLYQEDYGTAGNNVIGAAPGHPVIALALESATAALNRGDRDILWFSTGPGLLTRALARVLAGQPAALAGMRLFERRAMHQVVGMHCELGYKKTERHWSRTAFARRKR
ncbi:tetratricopeptide repeat protein, partial [Paracraurococcus ruber]|uniref:tetratricopeptide repeat protein n=1 Tax=Paracraurococcus ruber TaxID=77675 RepID=UPI001A915C85